MKGNKARAPNSQNKMRGKEREREREEEDEEGKKMANEKGGKEEKSIELKLEKRGELLPEKDFGWVSHIGNS